MTQITYPTDANNNTPTFTYTYDAMMRLATMTDQSNYTQPVVNGVQYNAANQVTAMNYYGFAETRAYNNLMQLSDITATAPGQTGINVTYNYTPGGNSGKVTSATDALSGETVTYQYDALNRLISAAGSGWAQTQAYDGFGNLIGRTGTGTAQGTTISTPVNAATNQLSGYAYDANGNQISSGYGYDAENRIVSANAGGVEYLYDAQNKRVWQGNFSGGVLTTQSVTLFGADGKMLNTYGIAQVGTTVSFGGGALRAYFGGKLVGQLRTSGLMGAVVQDRLGSVGKYYPYGEERNAPPLANDQVKFATYTRDAATGNDYADQRYYSSALGRFMTTDPHNGSRKPTNPASWNRYAYTRGDPVNHLDPNGLELIAPEFYCGPDCPNTSDDGGGGGGGGDCFILAFDDNGDPVYDCGDPGEPQQPPPSQPQPECFAQLKTRPVDDPRAQLVGATHSFWYVQDASGAQYVVSGGPCKLVNGKCSEDPNAQGTTYLDIWTSNNLTGGVDNISAHTSWSSGISPAICDMVQALLNAAGDFPNNTIQYKWYGPNSNSVAHYLGVAGGFNPPAPAGSFFGWGTELNPYGF